MSALLLNPFTACSDTDPGDVSPNLPEKEGVEHGALQKGPYVQFIGPGRARLVFETIIDEETPVRITRASGEVDAEASRSGEELSYRRPILGRNHPPDVPGLHVLHEIIIDDIQPDERIHYVIDQHAGPPIEGEFLGDVSIDKGFRLGWIADTMYPFINETTQQLAEQNADLIIHGGDITYDPGPMDSWNNFMAFFQPMMRSAAVHFAVGNHEFESQNEVVVQYDRLFSRQGDLEGSQRYYAFTYGGVRFIVLDSEQSGDIRNEESPQIQWLDQELAATNSDPNIREIIVAYHRPTYTLSKHGVSNLSQRENLHSRFIEHGVRLVLNGHAHCFEHFEVEGVNYIVDGGGGALLYDPDEDKDEIEAMRPGESDLRLGVAKTYGISTVDFHPNGGFTYRRVNARTGEVEHTFDVE